MHRRSMNTVEPPVNAWAAGVVCPQPPPAAAAWSRGNTEGVSDAPHAKAWGDSLSDDDDEAAHDARIRRRDHHLNRNVAPGDIDYMFARAAAPAISAAPSISVATVPDFSLTVVIENSLSLRRDFAVFGGGGFRMGPECPELLPAISSWLRQITVDARFFIGTEQWIPIRMVLHGRAAFDAYCGRSDADPDLALIGTQIIVNDHLEDLRAHADTYVVGYSRREITVAFVA